VDDKENLAVARAELVRLDAEIRAILVPIMKQRATALPFAARSSLETAMQVAREQIRRELQEHLGLERKVKQLILDRTVVEALIDHYQEQVLKVSKH
jgi:hypothetical protein